MIQIHNLGKAYHREIVLDLSELIIRPKESFGLVGNNGAGKTTLFRLILDLIRANKGEVKIKETPVQSSNSWKHYTGSYLDQQFLIEFLTPEEYFEFQADIHGMSEGDLKEFYLDFEDFFAGEILKKNKYIRDFSHGNKQKIGIAAAMMFKPEILILDEPFNGLDPSTQIRLIQRLNKLKNENGVTLLISSHDLNHVNQVCDRIVVLEKGKIVYDMEKNENTLKQLEQYFSN